MTEPVCDLVLLSWNHLEETKPCLESLLDYTRIPCRLLIVDNGSEEDVRRFLRSVKPRGAIQEVAVIQNETNEGFPRGMNRGIQMSRAPFVCLLNNDLRFTSGWLKEMIDIAEKNPSVGVINPTSSTFSNYPPKGMSLQAYANHLQQFRGQYVEVGMCIGFCMLVKRALLNQIGGLSEEVERIFFEDEDFCMRAQQAGYQCVVAEGCYVYHAEHRTVRKMPEREALFTKNRTWLRQRWGRRLRLAWPRFTPVAPGSTELRQWLEQLLVWVRRRMLLYVYVPTPAGMTKNELFRSVGLVPHADIHWHPVPQPFAQVVALSMILKRQKKPFDLIVAPESRWAKSVRGLQWLHHADVVLEANETELVTQWKHKSRSQL